MISKEELSDYAKQLGMSSYKAERDYFQHAFLSALYSVSSTEFVFKGGTALQKAYGLDRFSEDLDFTFTSEANELEFVRKASIEAGKVADIFIGKEFEHRMSASAKLKMKGPLYDGNEKKIQTLAVEISLREKVLLPPLALKIIPPYIDVKAYVALVMAPEEILAEKVRAIMDRNQPRDLYDIWFLLQKKTKPSLELIEKKLEFSKKTYDFSAFKKAVAEKRAKWLEGLKPLMKSVPDFGPVSIFVLENMPQE